MTNIIIGKKIAIILLPMSLAAVDPHTARHTSQLHIRPSNIAFDVERETLAQAILIVAPPSIEFAKSGCPALTTKNAMIIDPTKLAT